MIVIIYTTNPSTQLYYYALIPSNKLIGCSVYHIEYRTIPQISEYHTSQFLLSDIYGMFIQYGIDPNTEYNLTYIDYDKFIKKLIIKPK
jgi:hypothetical protein